MLTSFTRDWLEQHLGTRYGLLLTQRQLAELLDRSAAGLRWSLSHPSDPRTFALRDAARRVGRRVYFPATEVAAILAGPR